MTDPDEYGLEMESLIRETGGENNDNPIPRIKEAVPTPRSSSNHRKQHMILFALCIVTAAWFLSPAPVDQNTLVTNVEELPEATNIEDSSSNTEERLDDGNIIHVPEAPEHDSAIDVSSSSSTTTTTTTQHANRNVPATVELQHPELPGFLHPPPYGSSAYVRRARHDRTNLPDLTQSWGAWTLQDTIERPHLEALYAQYPNRDVPTSAFPPNAWQVDPEYVPQFVDQGIALTERALAAMLAEYGHFQRGVTHLDDALADATHDDPAYMFNMSMPGAYYHKKHPPGNAGRTSPTTLQFIRKHLLHSIVTEDKFFLTMGGHSSSAGHGNHFTQSYIMQVQRALEPILARLGVFHISRNVGMGGLGTVHNGMASQSLYGGDNAILVWNSGMTEGDMKPRDIFARQGLLGGDRVPVLLGQPVNGRYDNLCGAGYWGSGEWGDGYAGIPETATYDDIKNLPYATLFLICSKEMNAECRKSGYNGVCWIDREDYTPGNQLNVMGGRAKWHPGNWNHQLTSRFISFNIIKVLRNALVDWRDRYNYTLPDSEFHITDDYERIRTAVRQDNTSPCFDLGLPDAICNIPFHGHSEFTPRANPATTSLRRILRSDMDVGSLKPNAYDPPDVYNPALDPPDGQIDYLAIVENGVDFVPLRARYDYLHQQLNPPPYSTTAAKSKLIAGKGWQLHDSVGAPDNCDATYDSFCNRAADNNCLLYGHNDARASLLGDGLSGWLLMTLNQVKEGYIIVRLFKSKPNDNSKTLGWKCENNEEKCDHPLNDDEANAPTSKDFPEHFQVQYSIDGVVTTWTAEQYTEQAVEVERLMEFSVLLNAPEEFAGKPPKDIELGIRILGGRDATFGFSHVYWA